VAETPIELIYWIKRLVSSLLLPPFGFFVCSALALAWSVMAGGRRFASSLSLFSLLLGLLVSTGWASRGLVGLVEDLAGSPLSASGLKTILAAPNAPQAVVILAGGLSYDEREPDGPVTPSWWTLQRTLYGTRLAKQTGLKVLVSGGAPPGHGISEAQAMAQVMSNDLGRKPDWIESQSLDTRGNAKESAKLLLPAGVKHVLLVTHAAHMMRSRIEFERLGLKVTPAPMGFQAAQGAPHAMSWLPTPSGSLKSWYAVHEIVGLLWYRLSVLNL
jgi:uncharacterized SAM-binding protein YcdF (DUF218 family)